MDNRFQLDIFEGPLDLLLYLVKKEEVDIYEVNLTRLATQFIEYIELMRRLDLDVAGEFLVMSATLMFIKSRELLPVHQQVQIEEEEADDPRWELIRQLVEYKKFKDAANRLQEREELQDHLFPRRGSPWTTPLPESRPRRPQVSLLDLVNAVSAVLKRFNERQGDSRAVFEDRWTVSEKLELLMRLVREGRVMRFSELFAADANVTETVVTFLALLELIRLKRLIAVQREPFAEIEIHPVPEEPCDLPSTGSSEGDPSPAAE